METNMKTMKLLLGALASMPLLLQTALATPPDVTVMYKQGVGNYLADATGRALYWTKKDTPQRSNCVGPCLEKWQPFYNGAVLSASPDMAASDFGTILRSDGRMQTTFRGYPLYYYTMDQQRGDTVGENVNNAWHVMLPGKFHLVEKYYTGYSMTVGTTSW
jgi:predicted lipoprotein with Yx(FWY)xxD motif